MTGLLLLGLWTAQADRLELLEKKVKRLEKENKQLKALFRKVAEQAPPDVFEELARLAPDVLKGARPGEGFVPAVRAANERNALGTLKQLCSVQVTFKTLDLDENAINDYWVGDLSCLYRREPGGKGALRLIELAMAQADAAPIKEGKDIGKSLCERPEPKAGYLFRVIPEYEEADGKFVKYDQGAGRNVDRFGACAYPAEYGKAGKLTFIVSEGGTLFKKDTGGKPVDRFPLDPVKEGWSKVD
jgi:hypothetical protein